MCSTTTNITAIKIKLFVHKGCLDTFRNIKDFPFEMYICCGVQNYVSENHALKHDLQYSRDCLRSTQHSLISTAIADRRRRVQALPMEEFTSIALGPHKNQWWPSGSEQVTWDIHLNHTQQSTQHVYEEVGACLWYECSYHTLTVVKPLFSCC